MSDTELTPKGPFVGVPLMEFSEPATRERGPLMVEQLRATEIRIYKRLADIAEALRADEQRHHEEELAAASALRTALLDTEGRLRADLQAALDALHEEGEKRLDRLSSRIEIVREHVQWSEMRFTEALTYQTMAVRTVAAKVVALHREWERRTLAGRWRRLKAWVASFWKES